MPRTEREVDVWRNWTTGGLRGRVIEKAPFGRSFTPTYDEIINHIYQPWRYKFSMDNGKVPEHAYINIEKYKMTEGHPKHLLEWFDESHFNGDVAIHPSNYLEVPKLNVAINTHSKNPGHLPLPTTHVQPNFYRSPALIPDFDAFATRVRQFCLFISKVSRENNPGLHEVEVTHKLHVLHDWLSSSSLLFILQGTLAYLEECTRKPFEYVLDHFADQIEQHMHADFGTHWSQYAQAFDAHAREQENRTLLRDETHVMVKAEAFMKRIQFLVNRLFSNSSAIKVNTRRENMELSETEAKREVSEIIHMAEAFHSTILYFPDTFRGLNELFESMRISLYTLDDVRHKFNTHVRAAFIRESESFRSRLPR
jgi:hypothetical protein